MSTVDNKGRVVVRFSGVIGTELNDLDDVSAGSPGDGQVLTWNVSTQKWEPETGSGGASDFTDLGDVPSSYTGDGGKFVKVKATEDGLEFDVGGASTTFLDLTDTPSSYSGQGSKAVTVKGDVSGLEFTDVALQTELDSHEGDANAHHTWPIDLDDINNVNAPTPSDGHVLTWDDGNSEWVASAAGGGASTFTDLTDTPANYSGDAGKTVRVNSTPDGLEFVTAKYIKIFTFGMNGTLETGSLGMRIHAPKSATITNVKATVGTAPSGDSVIIDINKNGTTIFSTQGNRPSISSGSNDDLSSTPDVTSVAANDVFTCDIDQVGSTTEGSDLVVQVIMEVEVD